MYVYTTILKYKTDDLWFKISKIQNYEIKYILKNITCLTFKNMSLLIFENYKYNFHNTVKYLKVKCK